MSNQSQSQTAPLQNSTGMFITPDIVERNPNVSAVNNANNVSTQPQPPSFLQKKGLLGGKQGNMGYVSSETGLRIY